jgi:hypothetical protein
MLRSLAKGAGPAPLCPWPNACSAAQKGLCARVPLTGYRRLQVVLDGMSGLTYATVRE